MSSTEDTPQKRLSRITIAAAAICISTAGSLQCHRLLLGSKNLATRTRAAAQLAAGLRVRIRGIVMARFDELRLVTIHQERIVEEILSFLLTALPACRARTPQQLMEWVTRRTLAFIDGPDTEERRQIVPKAGATDTQEALRRENLVLLHSTLARLTYDQRQILEMKARKNMSWAAIAGHIGISVTVAQRRWNDAQHAAEIAVLDVLRDRERIIDTHDNERRGLAA